MKRSENAPEMQEWFSVIFQAAKEETVVYKGETLITKFQIRVRYLFICHVLRISKRFTSTKVE